MTKTLSRHSGGAFVFSGLIWVLLIAPTANADQPNLLLLIADDMGVDKVGAYGFADAPSTPVIDKLAEDGVLFRNCWGTPLCSSSRACLFTGKYPYRTGVMGASTPETSLQPEETILPELLEPLGYRSGLFGKWHVGSVGEELAPNVAGWDHYSGSLSGALLNFYVYSKTTNGVTEPERGYATTVTVDDALDWIGEQGETPWLCCVAFHAPHTPLHAPPDELHNVDLEGLDPDSHPVPFYNAMCEAMDTEIGRLLANLGPEADRTLVLFVGDNGSYKDVITPPLDPAQGKGTVYQGGVQIPCIVSGYGVNSPGREVDDLVHLADVFATLAELSGVPNKTGLDSVSFLPQIENRTADIHQRSSIYTEVGSDPYGCRVAAKLQHCQRAIRNAKFKVVFDQTNLETQYFDLSNDPFETIDLYNADLPLIDQLQFLLLRAKLHTTRLQPQVENVTNQAKEVLQQLPRRSR